MAAPIAEPARCRGGCLTWYVELLDAALAAVVCGP